MQQELSLVAEYGVFSVMLGVSVVIGLYFGCVKKDGNTVNEYLLGGKKMAVFPIVMSLIARYDETLERTGPEYSFTGRPRHIYKPPPPPPDRQLAVLLNISTKKTVHLRHVLPRNINRLNITITVFVDINLKKNYDRTIRVNFTNVHD